MDKDQNYTNVLLEEVRGDIKAILEVVVPMRQELAEVKKAVADIPEIKADIKTIKAALTDTNQQVQNHEQRITKLETQTI
jgi:predicted  nucleic acid-binding Zn-ribbon protein